MEQIHSSVVGFDSPLIVQDEPVTSMMRQNNSRTFSLSALVPTVTQSLDSRYKGNHQTKYTLYH